MLKKFLRRLQPDEPEPPCEIVVVYLVEAENPWASIQCTAPGRVSDSPFSQYYSGPEAPQYVEQIDWGKTFLYLHPGNDTIN